MKNVALILLVVTVFSACNQPKNEPPVEATPPPVEIADSKYIDMCKESLRQLAEGDVDGFVSNYADNARWYWNSGDSVISKASILAYWKDRRSNVIDTITYTREAWLAIKGNQPPKHLPGGIYVFNWARFTIKYKNGKSVTQDIHNVFHFDSADKVDISSQFLDRAPIAAALAAK